MDAAIDSLLDMDDVFDDILAPMIDDPEIPLMVPTPRRPGAGAGFFASDHEEEEEKETEEEVEGEDDDAARVGAGKGARTPGCGRDDAVGEQTRCRSPSTITVTLGGAFAKSPVRFGFRGDRPPDLLGLNTYSVGSAGLTRAQTAPSLHNGGSKSVGGGALLRSSSRSRLRKRSGSALRIDTGLGLGLGLGAALGRQSQSLAIALSPLEASQSPRLDQLGSRARLPSGGATTRLLSRSGLPSPHGAPSQRRRHVPLHW